MSAIDPRAGLPIIDIAMTEWDTACPRKNEALRGLSLRGDPSSQALAVAIRDRVEVKEGYDGLEIISTSFVGQISIGRLQLTIRPKLPALPLTALFRYAYGLRDLAMLHETTAPTLQYGVQDLLVILLANEVEELLHRGLARHYVPIDEMLESPRGKIRVDAFVRNGGLREAKLPCRHFERQTDWSLNQVLLAGLDKAVELTSDRDLRRRVHQLATRFDGVTRKPGLSVGHVDETVQRLTRLTAASASALALIRLLLEGQGWTSEQGSRHRMPGFLFDMNRFFQRLLSRFLHEHLVDQQIADEQSFQTVLTYRPGVNPKRRKAPQPRPDYALLRGADLQAFLDAKYRDIWESGLPPDWLYQLSIYALASPSSTSVLLYASMAVEARDEMIDIRRPYHSATQFAGSVILRPVPLPYLASIVDPASPREQPAARRSLATRLASLRPNPPITR